jgi:hypothetical protein
MKIDEFISILNDYEKSLSTVQKNKNRNYIRRATLVQQSGKVYSKAFMAVYHKIQIW